MKLVKLLRGSLLPSMEGIHLLLVSSFEEKEKEEVAVFGEADLGSGVKLGVPTTGIGLTGMGADVACVLSGAEDVESRSSFE